ncbi:MAG: ParB/RepB/Spo0J family partition protein [Bacteroidales bacterium]|nr:ParB/RepB/Spo0J family partition protein [Bacteroidales bacterium]
MAKRSALGRGLGALLADAGVTPQQTRDIHRIVSGNPTAVSEIPLEAIVPNPWQPREGFDPEALEELTDSIRTLGIIQPLTLRQTGPDSYQIISGERRYRAAKAAGLITVPAYIRQADDAAMLEMAIVENIQREDLDPVETAISFQRLIDECNLTQEAMALRVGKKRATVTNYLRLLRLPESVQKALKTGQISTGHAKALLSVPSREQQISLCEKTIRGDWSVRQLEQHVRQNERKAAAAPAPTPESRSDIYQAIAERMGRSCGGRVSVRRSSKGGGTITIRYDDPEKAQLLLQMLDRSENR